MVTLILEHGSASTFTHFGNTTHTGTFGVTGNSTLTGTLTVTGDLSAAGGAFSGNASVGGTLTVTGLSTLAATIVGGTLKVNSTSEFDAGAAYLLSSHARDGSTEQGYTIKINSVGLGANSIPSKDYVDTRRLIDFIDTKIGTGSDTDYSVLTEGDGIFWDKTGGNFSMREMPVASDTKRGGVRVKATRTDSGSTVPTGISIDANGTIYSTASVDGALIFQGGITYEELEVAPKSKGKFLLSSSSNGALDGEDNTLEIGHFFVYSGKANGDDDPGVPLISVSDPEDGWYDLPASIPVGTIIARGTTGWATMGVINDIDLTDYLPLIGGTLRGTLNVDGTNAGIEVKNASGFLKLTDASSAAELGGTLNVKGVSTFENQVNVQNSSSSTNPTVISESSIVVDTASGSSKLSMKNATIDKVVIEAGGSTGIILFPSADPASPLMTLSGGSGLFNHEIISYGVGGAAATFGKSTDETDVGNGLAFYAVRDISDATQLAADLAKLKTSIDGAAGNVLVHKDYVDNLNLDSSLYVEKAGDTMTGSLLFDLDGTPDTAITIDTSKLDSSGIGILFEDSTSSSVSSLKTTDQGSYVAADPTDSDPVILEQVETTSPLVVVLV